MIGTGMVADDYFGGGGGWDIACTLLDIEVTGYEILDEARRTRSAAGLKTSEVVDVRDVTTSPGKVDLQIASPPCQSFSMAGKGVGRQALDAVLQVVASYRDGHPMSYAEAAALMGDDRTGLVVEPLRLALEGRPMFIAWEQVPPVLPVWEACADVLRRNGYSVVTGCLNAEQYGVPQTRKRAILIARRDGREAYMPKPTHSQYYGRTPARLDEGVDKWVSMAEALGWGMTARPYPVIPSGRTTGGPDALKVGGSLARQIIYDEYDAGRWVDAPGAGALVGFPRRDDGRGPEHTITIDGQDYRKRDLRPVDHPAPTVTEKARGWQVILPTGGDRPRWEIVDVVMFDDDAGPPAGGDITAEKAMGAGMVERYGERPGRTLDQPAFTIRASAGGQEPGGFRWVLRNNTSENACERSIDEPAGTLYFGQHLNGAAWHLRMTTMPNATVRRSDEPAPTIAFGKDANSARWVPGWPYVRPSTTVLGDPRISAPGHRDRSPDGERQHAKSIRISVAEAAVLQSFPYDYPWQGSLTKQFLQIGNAIPPLLAYRILCTFLDQGRRHADPIADFFTPVQLSLFDEAA